MNTLTDPTFITAAIAAFAAVASAWISWHGFRRQTEAATAPPVVNAACSRGRGRTITLGLEFLNTGVVRWHATTLEIRHPAGARVATLAELTRRFPNRRPALSAIDGLTGTCRLDVEIAPAGITSRSEASDRHWIWASVLLAQDEAATLSMRLTFESMEASPRCKVIAIKRQLPAAASTEM